MKNKPWIILTLGLLSAVSPFTVDMYLPAFPKIAADLHTTTSDLALTLSSYFLGLSLGQLFYGPLLDRFGRKKPLYGGLLSYVIASLGCMFSHSLESLVLWRFLAGAGGCVSSIAALAMVRDLFSSEESAKILSLIVLVVGASPLLAPIVGSIVALHFGWQTVFLVLIFVVLFILTATVLILPERHSPDHSIQLTPLPIMRSYWSVLKTTPFAIYSLAGGCSFAALFSYIAASPIVFFNFFKLNMTSYSFIFTALAAGFIGASQFNIFLLRFFKSQSIFQGALICQGTVSLLFLLLVWLHCLTLPLAFVLLFILLASIGIGSPNATALAINPFHKTAGRASALFTFFQMLLGTLSSLSVGFFHTTNLIPIALILVASPLVAFAILQCDYSVGYSQVKRT